MFCPTFEAPMTPPGTPLKTDARVAYLIPEFPGQTHIWMWREIVHLRDAGVRIDLFSTRRPPIRDRARHDFADDAIRETTYLWPPGMGLVVDLLWAMFCRPRGFWNALRLAFTLPVNRRPAFRGLLPLIPAACKLARVIERRGLKRLHSHTCSNSAVLAMMAGQMTGRPYSLTLNANVEWWGGAMAEKFGRAEFTVAITQWLFDQVRSEYPSLQDDQLILGRIGVDTHKWFPPAVNEQVDHAASSGLSVLAVGRLHHSKGYEVLLEALSQLGDGIHLTLVGDGPEAEKLRDQVRELGLDKRVVFTGSLSENAIIEHMRSADVFVLSSHAEPLGVVLMEAMAMGVAVIGTDAGGVGEIVTSGKDGLLVAPGDPKALAEALKVLADDPLQRSRLARAGRDQVVQAFDSRLGAGTLYAQFTGQDPGELFVP